MDRAELAELLPAEVPGLMRYATSLVRDPHLAEDLVGDTLVRALERAASYRGDARLGTWLHRILHNLAVDRARSAREVPAEDIAVKVENQWRADEYTVDLDVVVARAETREELRDALIRLPYIYRSAVLLHDAEGLTMREVAGICDVELPAAKQRLRRGRMMLVSALAEGAERRVAARSPIELLGRPQSGERLHRRRTGFRCPPGCRRALGVLPDLPCPVLLPGRRPDRAAARRRRSRRCQSRARLGRRHPARDRRTVTGGHARLLARWRREWDSNPRRRLPASTVFKTVPFGRSGIPPRHVSRLYRPLFLPFPSASVRLNRCNLRTYCGRDLASASGTLTGPTHVTGISRRAPPDNDSSQLPNHVRLARQRTNPTEGEGPTSATSSGGQSLEFLHAALRIGRRLGIPHRQVNGQRRLRPLQPALVTPSGPTTRPCGHTPGAESAPSPR